MLGLVNEWLRMPARVFPLPRPARAARSGHPPEGDAGFVLGLGPGDPDILQHAIIQGAETAPLGGPLLPKEQGIQTLARSPLARRCYDPRSGETHRGRCADVRFAPQVKGAAVQFDQGLG